MAAGARDESQARSIKSLFTRPPDTTGLRYATCVMVIGYFSKYSY